MVFVYLLRQNLMCNRSFFQVLPDDVLIIILRRALALSKSDLIWKYEPFSRMALYLFRTISFSDHANNGGDLSRVRIGKNDRDFDPILSTCASVFDTLEIDSSRAFYESDARRLKFLCKPQCTLHVAFHSNSGIISEENVRPVMRILGAFFARIKVVRPLHGMDENLHENGRHIRNLLLNYSFDNLKSFQYTAQDLTPLLGRTLWRKLGVSLEEISMQVRMGKKWCELLAQIGTHCRHLKVIDLDNPFDDPEMTEESYVDLLSSYGDNLLKANLVFDQFINQPQWRKEPALSKLVNICPNLRFNWKECDEDVPNFHRLDTLGKHVESLRLHSFRTNPGQKHLTMRKCSSLKELIISSDPGSLSCELFQDIFAGFPDAYNHLERLTFYNVIYTGLYLDILVSSNISHLKQLKIYSLVMNSSILNDLSKFIRNNPQLESIFLVEHPSEQIKYRNTLDIVAQVVSEAEKCKKLKELNVFFVNRNMPQTEEMKSCCNRLRLSLVAYTFGFSDSQMRSSYANT